MPSTVGSIGSRLAIVNPVAEVSEKSETHYSFETNYVDDARCARELRSSQDETVCSACNTGRGVFECCLSLKEVELNEGLESIGAGAFKGCKDLASRVCICVSYLYNPIIPFRRALKWRLRISQHLKAGFPFL